MFKDFLNEKLINLQTSEKEKDILPSKAIETVIASMKMSPKQCAHGNCDEFAFKLQKIIGGSVYETDFNSKYSGHFFLKHTGKFYDAEHPKGVVNWKELIGG